jgi:hypothetical protein
MTEEAFPTVTARAIAVGGQAKPVAELGVTRVDGRRSRIPLRGARPRFRALLTGAGTAWT